jgi:hypothetical protein
MNGDNIFVSQAKEGLGMEPSLDSDPDFTTCNTWDINLGIYLILGPQFPLT